MHSRGRALLIFGLALIGLLLVSALLYQIGMDRFEGKPRDFWSALEWAGETITTTGYGKDAGWSHPLMVVFVIAVQFAGVLLVFLLLPIVLLPFLEARFEVRLPRRFEKAVDHVVIYRHGPAVETLLEQLDLKHVPHVVIEQDEAIARSLLEKGRTVVWCPEGADPLAAVPLETRGAGRPRPCAG